MKRQETGIATWRSQSRTQKAGKKQLKTRKIIFSCEKLLSKLFCQSFFCAPSFWAQHRVYQRKFFGVRRNIFGILENLFWVFCSSIFGCIEVVFRFILLLVLFLVFWRKLTNCTDKNCEGKNIPILTPTDRTYGTRKRSGQTPIGNL